MKLEEALRAELQKQIAAREETEYRLVEAKRALSAALDAAKTVVFMCEKFLERG
jgi:hypothetical protein